MDRKTNSFAISTNGDASNIPEEEMEIEDKKITPTKSLKNSTSSAEDKYEKPDEEEDLTDDTIGKLRELIQDIQNYTELIIINSHDHPISQYFDESKREKLMQLIDECQATLDGDHMHLMDKPETEEAKISKLKIKKVLNFIEEFHDLIIYENEFKLSNTNKMKKRYLWEEDGPTIAPLPYDIEKVFNSPSPNTEE